MSTSIGAFPNVKACHRGRRPRTIISRNVIGGAAIACAVTACGWTVYAKVFCASIYPIVGTGTEILTSAPDVSARGIGAPAEKSRVADTSFADRFAPLANASPAEPKKQNTYVALLDPTYSLGSPPEMFSTDPRPKPDRRLIALTTAATPEPSGVAAEAKLPLPPMGRQLALNTAPPARPSERLLRNANPTVREIAEGARAAALATAAVPKPTIFEKLFGKPQSGPVLAYAGSDGGILSNGQDAPSDPPRYDRSTAVYDISARTVYMPDGTKLEAHSGLGSRLDDPRFVHERMRGATPPHVYDLTMRESLFHGVAALRLNPVGGEGAIFGRTGLLAHTYMLGPNGDSNGCVSFRDYNAFLQAYKAQRVRRLVVVAKLD